MSNLIRVYIRNNLTSTVFYLVMVDRKCEWREKNTMIDAVREAMWFDRNSDTFSNMYKEVADFIKASPSLAKSIEVIVEDNNHGTFYRGDLEGLGNFETTTTHIKDAMASMPEVPPVENSSPTPPERVEPVEIHPPRQIVSTTEVLDVANEEIIDEFCQEFNDKMSKGQWVLDHATYGAGGKQYWKFTYAGTFNACTIAAIEKILHEGGWKILDVTHGESRGAFIDGPFTCLDIGRAV
jgi:hypothetical protein